MKNHIEIPTTQTLDTMLHSILNQALVSINAEAGSLMIVDEKEGILQIKSRLGRPKKTRTKEPVYRIGEKGIAGKVVSSAKPYLSKNVNNDPFFSESISGNDFKSLLSAPVINYGKVIAVINADSEIENFFGEQELKILENICEQVSAPIAERMSIFEALAHVSVELMQLPTQGGSVVTVLEKIANAAISSLGADLVTLYQYDETRDEFLVKDTGPTMAGNFFYPEFMRRKVYSDDVPRVIVRDRIIDFYDSVGNEKMLTGEIERPNEEKRLRFVEREKIQSMAALILPSNAAESGAEIVGVMFANYRDEHKFNFDEREVLKTFSDYAAIAILNARKEEQRRKDQIKMVESIAANFAHRMSNLAGRSRINTQLLREMISNTNSKGHKYLNEIQRESDILLTLAKKLSDPFKKKGKMFDLSPLNLEKLVNEEISHLETLYSFDSNVDIRDIPHVLSVQFQLRQVIFDIIENALEAGEGKVEISIIGRPDKQSDLVSLRVIDNGPGIKEDMIERLFSPGTTTKENSLGIGLWWSQTFIQATGGDLDYRPMENKTCFELKIPSVLT